MRKLLLSLVVAAMAASAYGQCHAKQVPVSACPKVETPGTAMPTQTVSEPNGYWTFCPGGKCPTPPQTPPQSPPEFDFPEDEVAPVPVPPVPVPPAPGGLSLAMILSGVGAAGGLVAGYFANKESDEEVVAVEPPGEPPVV